MLYNSQFIDTEEALHKKLAHFLSSFSPTQYIRGALTSPHTCGCDVTSIVTVKWYRDKDFFIGVFACLNICLFLAT